MPILYYSRFLLFSFVLLINKKLYTSKERSRCKIRYVYVGVNSGSSSPSVKPKSSSSSKNSPTSGMLDSWSNCCASSGSVAGLYAATIWTNCLNESCRFLCPRKLPISWSTVRSLTPLVGINWRNWCHRPSMALVQHPVSGSLKCLEWLTVWCW